MFFTLHQVDQHATPMQRFQLLYFFHSDDLAAPGVFGGCGRMEIMKTQRKRCKIAYYNGIMINDIMDRYYSTDIIPAMIHFEVDLMFRAAI